jgi:hypothetical protein
MATHGISQPPMQRLLFYVVGDVDEVAREGVRRLIQHFGNARPWVVGPPRFVDHCDPAPAGSGDSDIQTVGGELEIYSARPDLSKEVDLAHFQEVESIVEGVRLLSQQQGLSFDFELDGTYVGSIERGDMNETLRVGLLGEWRKRFIAVR